MIYTQKEMAQATTSYEFRFRLAYLSVNFNPTVVFAREALGNNVAARPFSA